MPDRRNSIKAPALPRKCSPFRRSLPGDQRTETEKKRDGGGGGRKRKRDVSGTWGRQGKAREGQQHSLRKQTRIPVAHIEIPPDRKQDEYVNNTKVYEYYQEARSSRSNSRETKKLWEEEEEEEWKGGREVRSEGRSGVSLRYRKRGEEEDERGGGRERSERGTWKEGRNGGRVSRGRRYLLRKK